MNKIRLLLSVSILGLAALSLGGCADLQTARTADPHGAQTAASDPVPDQSVSTYGLFLAGHAAVNDGDGETASAFYLRAAEQQPDTAFLKDRAFLAALMAGDVHRAAGLAPGPEQGPIADQQLGRLTLAADDMAVGQAHDAETILAAPFGPPHRAAGLLLAPWVAAAAGDWKAALTLPDAKGDRWISELSRLNQALLLERRKHYDEADAAFRRLLADGDGSGLVTEAYVDFLLRRGRRADAVGICDAALKGDPNNRTMRLVRERAVAKDAPPPMLTIAQGAARALIAPAAIFLAEKQPELGLNYLQLSLRLDPDRDEAWMLIGDTKAAENDIEGARAAYRHVPPTSPDYVDARGRLIESYDQPGIGRRPWPWPRRPSSKSPIATRPWPCSPTPCEGRSAMTNWPRSWTR